MLWKIVGIIVCLNAVAIAATYHANADAPRRLVTSSILIGGLFVGFFLFLHDRITKMKVKGIGEMETVVEQATADAKTVTEIRRRIENQAATIDAVANQAINARKLSEDLEARRVLADEVIRKLDSKLVQVQTILDFTTTVLSAQGDSRTAFDQLGRWGYSDYPYKHQARMIYLDIQKKHSSPISLLPKMAVPACPTTGTITEVKASYTSTPDEFKGLFISELMERKDIDLKQRLQFFVDVMRTEKSLTAVEFAGRAFCLHVPAMRDASPIIVEPLVAFWYATGGNPNASLHDYLRALPEAKGKGE